MNQALQDVIEHRRTTNVFEPMRAARGLFRLEGRLAPSADAGFMSPELVAGWVGAAKGLYDDKPQMQRDEAIRSATFGAGSLLSAAEAHGFGSCPMIGFDAVAVASEFSLLPDEIPGLLVAIGRAATNNWPQKSRRPLTEVSFA
jgi:nitroreductase